MGGRVPRLFARLLGKQTAQERMAYSRAGVYLADALRLSCPQRGRLDSSSCPRQSLPGSIRPPSLLGGPSSGPSADQSQQARIVSASATSICSLRRSRYSVMSTSWVRSDERQRASTASTTP